jgi:hypothetical protein
MSDNLTNTEKAKEATPKRMLLKELIGQCTPMSEREWAAAEEIIRLQDQNAALLEALEDLVCVSLRYRLQDSDLEVGLARAAIAKARGE